MKITTSLSIPVRWAGIPGVCPKGYEWDPVKGVCIPIKPKPPMPAPWLLLLLLGLGLAAAKEREE